MAAELDILILINSSNPNIILHDVLVQLRIIINSTNINHGQSTQFLVFGKIYQLFCDDIVLVFVHHKFTKKNCHVTI